MDGMTRQLYGRVIPSGARDLPAEGCHDAQVAAIRKRVGAGSVFLLASGGVDSTVTAVLLGRALGPDRLHLLHVDNGLMRKDESRGVLAAFRAAGLGRNLHFIDATEDFLGALAGVLEPEKKRRAIGDTFIHVFEREARRLGIEGHLLGQGTIYPDTIETGGTKRADTIKTHHNRVPIVEEMIRQGRVIEPLADLYKVEVRELGELLGLDRDLIWKHPFPGPGLGVRLLCSSGVPDRQDFARMEPEVRRIAIEIRPGRSRAAHPLGRGEGGPSGLRASGDVERRGELGNAHRNGRHDLPRSRGHQPLPLEPRPGKSGRLFPGRRDA